jgi:hypothetical protein
LMDTASTLHRQASRVAAQGRIVSLILHRLVCCL